MTSQGGGGAGEDAAVRKRRKRPLCNNGNNNSNSNNLLLLPPDVAAVISSSSTTADKNLCFNDSVTADIDLSLHLYDDDDDDESTNIDDDHENVIHHLYLHSEVLLRGRSQYFSALLSDRWQRDSSSRSRYLNLTHKVPSSSMKSIDTHMTVIKLLYSTTDGVNFSETIKTVSSALSILPVAIELLFEDCVKACVRLIEALPWTEEEEKRVLDLIPLLKEEESQELLSRVKIDSSNEMLCRLIQQLRLHHHQRDFVAKMLRGDFPSKDSVRFALYHEFEICFQGLKDVLHSVVVVSCSSQTSLLEMVAGHGAYLNWLIARMVELKVADTALERWIHQEGGGGFPLTGNLQKVCSITDKRISPLHLFHVFECTWRLADAVATGSIVADRQVRMKLVKAWLPVVLCFKDMVFRIMPERINHQYEVPLFKILSTLPMSESQELLLLCIGFGNHNNVNYLCCPHLEPAYKTWFRRAANQPPKAN